MKKVIIFRPESELDIQEAFDWYEEQFKGLGSDFILCIDAALSLISRQTLLYPKIYKNIQRILIRRFPYGIYFISKKDKIIVLAIFHAKRNPIIWQKRL